MTTSSNPLLATTPLVFGQPAEWRKHLRTWLAWPSDESLWQENLLPAQKEFTALCRAIADGEGLAILVDTEKAEKDARSALKDLNVEFFKIPYGDIWLRDSAPIFIQTGKTQLRAASFLFNGWGGKYILDGDAEVSLAVAKASRHPFDRHSIILEGGAIDANGEGLCLTTKQCLLNPNRNPSLNQEAIEKILKGSLGFKKILWVSRGLDFDHTDGHIDNIARFIDERRIVCMRPSGSDDPQAEILKKIEAELKAFTDLEGRTLEVITVPSPGKVLNEDGEVMPASSVNFYIANTQVIVPLYHTPYDDEIVASIAKLFPERRTIGLSSRAILSGGGSFHCITQQEPETSPL